MANSPSVRVPRQSRAKKTRSALIAAGQAEFSARGYAATTARSVAERAGVSVGSFYQYFKTKDDLLAELARVRTDRIGDDALGALDLSTPGGAGDLAGRVRLAMRRVAEVVTEYHREDVGLHAVLTERRHADPQLEALSTASERRLVGRISDLLAALGRGGDTLAQGFVIFGMVEGAVHTHVLGGAVVDDERFFSALVDALVALALPPPATTR